MTDNVRVSKDEASVNKAVILGLTSRVTDYDMVGCSCEAEVELEILIKGILNKVCMSFEFLGEPFFVDV